MRCVTSDPLLDELPHESDENHANCNCEAAKIYLATGIETRRLANSVSRDSNHPPQYQQPQQQLPDMCLVERTVDIKEHDQRSVTPEDLIRPEIQQTSFITFKPAAIYGTARRPDSPPLERGIRADAVPIYGRFNSRELYGTLPAGTVHGEPRTPLTQLSIYEKRPTPCPASGCVECEREFRGSHPVQEPSDDNKAA